MLVISNSHPSQELRRQAVESIGRLSGNSVKKTLVELAWHGTPLDVERQAVESLGRIEEDTMDELAKIAQTHPSGDIRRQAVETMTRRDPDRALPILERILKEPVKEEDA